MSTLNEEQERAVARALPGTEPEVCQILIAAGAGTGKTRCLVSRAERLLEHGEDPASLAAMTFTNRAAKEMKERLGERGQGMQIGTFHGTAAALLRKGANPNFAIIDEDEAADLFAQSAVRATPGNEAGHATLKKSEARELLEPVSAWYANGNTGSFSRSPEAGETVRLSGRGGRPPHFDTTLKAIYEEYERSLLRGNLKDYDHLIAEAVVQLERAASTGSAGLKGRFRYREILVDEAQDTDTLQKRMVYAMRKHPGRFEPACKEGARLFFVGDDDQLIYSWRNARSGFFIETGALPDSRVHRLTLNYRSTPQILRTANAALQRNTERIGKELRARDGAPAGRKPECMESGSAAEEGGRIARIIARDPAGPGSWAVLSRTAMAFKMAEIALQKQGVDIRITAGRRLAQYKEVADLNALLRLAGNESDDPAFTRCTLNLCKGAGPRTLDQLTGHGIPMAEAAAQMDVRQVQPLLEIARAVRATAQFEGLADATRQAADWVSQVSIKDSEAKAELRRERLQQVIEAAIGIEADHPDATLREITSLLTLAPAGQEPGRETKAGGEDGHGQDVQRTTLGTIHSAKGREWDHVALIAFEDGILPSWSAIRNGDFEEERRLLHVAASRARKRLIISWSLHRNGQDAGISRFMEEIMETLRTP